jgi:hypothetical protein
MVFMLLPWLVEGASSDDVSSRFSISSPCNPFFSRKAIFFSCEASRTDASFRNVLACSRRALRSLTWRSPAASSLAASSDDVGNDSGSSLRLSVCQAGMEGFLVSAIVRLKSSKCVSFSKTVTDAVAGSGWGSRVPRLESFHRAER